MFAMSKTKINMTANNLIEKLSSEVLDSITVNAGLRMELVNLISSNPCENCRVESIEVLTDLLEQEVNATMKFKKQIEILKFLNERN